jgi:hypothetical protein
MYGCEVETPGDDDAADDLYTAAWDFDDQLPGGLAHDGGVELIGLWVAVGGSGRKGAADFNYAAFPLSAAGFREAYAEHYEKAQAAWPEFAKQVAEKTGITLGKPRLWLTTTETA